MVTVTTGDSNARDVNEDSTMCMWVERARADGQAQRQTVMPLL